MDLKFQLKENENENSDLIKQNMNYKEQIKAYKTNTMKSLSITKSLTEGDIAYSQFNVNDYKSQMGELFDENIALQIKLKILKTFESNHTPIRKDDGKKMVIVLYFG